MFETILLWLYVGCYLFMCYIQMEKRDMPRGLTLALGVAYAVGTVGLVCYLTRIMVPGAPGVWWAFLLLEFTVTSVNDIRWYGVLIRRPAPVPAFVNQAATIIGCVGDFLCHVPCMVVLYRLTQGMVAS